MRLDGLLDRAEARIEGLRLAVPFLGAPPQEGAALGLGGRRDRRHQRTSDAVPARTLTDEQVIEVEAPLADLGRPARVVECVADDDAVDLGEQDLELRHRPEPVPAHRVGRDVARGLALVGVELLDQRRQQLDVRRPGTADLGRPVTTAGPRPR